MNPTQTTQALIAEGATLNARIEADSARLKEIKAELVKLPPGKHPGCDGTSCQVIAPAPTIKLHSDDVDAVKELTGDDAFKKLFERSVAFKPVKAFRELLAALVNGKRDQKKVLDLTETPGTPYVKFA